MFSGCTVPPDSKETKLGSSDQEASPSAGKNTGIVFVPCCTWKCIPTAIYSGVDISEVSGCHLLQQLSSQWGHKNYFKDWCHELTTYLSVLNLFLTQCIMVMLSEGCKLDNFEPQNSLKHSCVNIWGFCSNFVECGSFLESNSLDILALCETNMDDSIDSGNFSVRGYLPLIQKDSIVCMVLQFMWKKNFLFHRAYLQKTLRIVTYVFDCLYFTHCLTSFSSIMDSFLFHYNIDEVLLINPSADVFVFGDSNIHHKDWLTNW